MWRPGELPSFIGVLHLAPLPAAPRPGPGLDGVIRRALADAETLAAHGADAVILENLGDAPFEAESVGPYVVAAMTRVALAVREAHPTLQLGINVLRNDALAAMAIAAAVEAQFIRVNVHTGVMVTDQGVITGRARETLLLRRALDADVRVAADVFVKHASPLGSPDFAQSARDTWHRGGASALIVTGSGTGQAISLERLRAAREAVPEACLWAGSGVTPDQLPAILPWIDAAIVGTYCHQEGRLDAPLDPIRVRAVRAALG